MNLRRNFALLLVIALGATLLSGCMSAFKPEPVKPWEHDILAWPAMQTDTEPTLSAQDDHIYFSREATKGGNGYGGGGCGCN